MLTPKPQPIKEHMNHFIPPATGLLQRQCGVDAKICHFSLPSRKFGVGLAEGRLG